MRLTLLVLPVLALAFVPNLAWPQDASQPDRYRESVSLNLDNTVVKKLETVGDYFSEKQWDEGIKVLQQESEAHGDTLIRLSPGRYVNVAHYCNLILAGLPTDGLAAYRQKVDPQARQWFERGQSRRDAVLLRRIVQAAFVSSYGDDALWLLAEWAWSENRLSDARYLWESLLPLPQKPPLGKPLPLLAYPDSSYAIADVRARLVLCSLLEGDRERAQRELLAFDKLHPSADGKLAGRSGRLARILEGIVYESRRWNVLAPKPGAESYALNTRRNKILPQKVDIGTVQWRIDLSANRFHTSKIRPALIDRGPLSYFPVTHGNLVLVNDADAIYAFDLKTGRPAWPVGQEDNGAIYPSVPVESIKPLKATVGVPFYTLTVYDGRLYARMGPPVTARAKHELRVDSQLVCLDLKESQGKPLWIYPINKIDLSNRRRTGDIPLQGGPAWAFEGTPVVTADRLYVVLRRSHPNTQFNLACLNSLTGELIWNRSVCAALANVDDSKNYLGHTLLTLADDMLFYSTGIGAIVALNTNDGTFRWATTYESQLGQSDSDLSDHTKQSLTPCLYHNGIVVAAPPDTDRVMAIDSKTGIVRWQKRLGDRTLHLLGVGRGRLVVSGRRLWGIDIHTGRVVWRLAASMGVGYGRGLLVEDEVYWPTHDRLLIVKQTSGILSRQPVLLRRAHGESGGNLLIAGGLLLIAQPRRLIAFGEKAGPGKLPAFELTATTFQRTVAEGQNIDIGAASIRDTLTEQFGNPRSLQWATRR